MKRIDWMIDASCRNPLQHQQGLHANDSPRRAMGLRSQANLGAIDSVQACARGNSPLPSGASRSRSGSTRGAISADFHACDGNLEAAVLLHLFFQVVEESAFELRDSATTQTGHVHVLARCFALVKMFLTLEMHQIEFINQSMSL